VALFVGTVFVKGYSIMFVLDPCLFPAQDPKWQHEGGHALSENTCELQSFMPRDAWSCNVFCYFDMDWRVSYLLDYLAICVTNSLVLYYEPVKLILVCSLFQLVPALC
jgi:hypothetical protein